MENRNLVLVESAVLLPSDVRDNLSKMQEAAKELAEQEGCVGTKIMLGSPGVPMSQLYAYWKCDSNIGLNTWKDFFAINSSVVASVPVKAPPKDYYTFLNPDYDEIINLPGVIIGSPVQSSELEIKA